MFLQWFAGENVKGEFGKKIAFALNWPPKMVARIAPVINYYFNGANITEVRASAINQQHLVVQYVR